jgi:hypothetical protein
MLSRSLAAGHIVRMRKYIRKTKKIHIKQKVKIVEFNNIPTLLILKTDCFQT